MATRKEKIGYGLGDMSSSIYWKLISFYLPILFSSIYRLDLITTGTIMLISQVWDAITDPLMGIISDRTNTRWGKFRPYILFGSIPLAISACLLFSAPSSGNSTVWAYATYLLMLTAYTVINVPYSAMLGVITKDFEQKTHFASYRMAFAYAGSFLLVLIWEPLCNNFGEFKGALAAQGWQGAIIIIGIITVALFALCFFLTREEISPMPPRTSREEIQSLLKNMPWWILSGTAVCTNFFNTFRNITTFNYFRYCTDGDQALITANIFILIGEIANIVGIIFLTVPLSKRFDKKNVMAGCGFVMAALSIAFYHMPDTSGGMIGSIVLQALIGLCTGIISPLIWSMYADVADYSFSKNDSCSIGLVFSSGSMSQKLGSAIAATLVMWLLASFGLNTDIASQPGTAIIGLKLCMSYYPAGIAIIMAVAALIYPLDASAMKKLYHKMEFRFED